ncbi:MAG: hypothetical protein NC328_04760 [Muribaculum sp.]|nr:hypothetical protein [Muribaculum sp.]
MANQDYRELINRIYELGALMELADSPSAPKRMGRMLRERLDAIYGDCKEVADSILEREEDEENDSYTTGDEVGSYVIDDDPVDETDSIPDENSESGAVRDRSTIQKNDTVAKPASSSKKPSGKLFTLNDRFLYSRELFGGNLKEFDKSMLALAGMDSYEEAEAYFTEEYDFDMDNPHVKSFLAVIAKMYPGEI